MNGHHLVLGGAKSGKTRFAEELVLNEGKKVAYIATGRAWDDEMRARINAHQKSRSSKFKTIEAPINLISSLEEARRKKLDLVLVDCLTLWITNLMMAEMEPGESVDALVHWLETNANLRVVLVSNEVGQGIVPDNAMAREFRDHAGTSHQKLAQICEMVTFVTAGIPQRLKG
ncbi:bifunctional adenosylcobinamide kinase/adenosylcobinamide-phosphate guanylyltransferase [Maritalea sp.]|uniref:bifunctional adenosylcobinamide kinase/adenosylcobinamide-phosphate guanylyltransferase n=1 Tax=Maritalea sp. TaxID=2003361 RepID=UPI003EF10114